MIIPWLWLLKTTGELPTGCASTEAFEDLFGAVLRRLPCVRRRRCRSTRVRPSGGCTLGTDCTALVDSPAQRRQHEPLGFLGTPEGSFRMKRLTEMACCASLLWLFVSGASAEPKDPRIGEWREDHYAGGVGLYMIYEDLGNGMTRTHSAENLAQQNRLHEDTRCDGNFYPRINAKGEETEITVSCTLLDARTVQWSYKRNAADGWVEGEGKWILSDDGTHSVGTLVRTDRDGKVVETVTRMFTRNAESCLNHADEAAFRRCQERTGPPRPR